MSLSFDFEGGAARPALDNKDACVVPSGCKTEAAAAHGKSVADLLRSMPLEWLVQGEAHKEGLLGACQGSELMVSLFHAPDGLQIAGLQVLAAQCTQGQRMQAGA